MSNNEGGVSTPVYSGVTRVTKKSCAVVVPRDVSTFEINGLVALSGFGFTRLSRHISCIGNDYPCDLPSPACASALLVLVQHEACSPCFLPGPILD
jgi:hypothetical protein